MRLLRCARIDVSTCACGHVCECQPLLTGTSALSNHIHPNPSTPHPPPPTVSSFTSGSFSHSRVQTDELARSKTASLHSSARAHITAPLAAALGRALMQEPQSPLWLFCLFTVAVTMEHKMWKQYIIPWSPGVFQTALHLLAADSPCDCCALLSAGTV